MRRSVVVGFLFLLACGRPPVSDPVQAAAAPPAAPEQATPRDPCSPTAPDDPAAARYLAFLEAEVARGGQRIGAELCIARVDGPHAVQRGSDNFMIADLVVYDRASGVQAPVRAYSQGDGTRWRQFTDRFVAQASASEIALRQLPAWLRGQPGLRAVSRRSPADGTSTWLAWLGRAESSTVCLDTRRADVRCWNEPGEVRGLVLDEWTFADEDTEEQPTGLLSVLRANARTVHWGLRTQPELERALAARRTLPPPTRRPGWARPRIFAEPQPELPRARWRGIEIVETPSLGPLPALRVEPVCVEDGLTVVVARSQTHARLCARTSEWACGPIYAPGDGGSPNIDNRVVDAFRLGPGRLATLRATHEAGGEVPDTAAGGHALLEIHRIEGAELPFVGAIPVGQATWTTRTGPDGRFERQLESVFHPARREADDCVRLDSAETFVGRTSARFERQEPGAPLNLARAGDVMPMLDTTAASMQTRQDRGGLWRVEEDQLRRVDRCGDTETDRLVAPAIPAALPDRAAACLAGLSARIERLTPAASVDAERPCGAVVQLAGEFARERYRYEGGRRVETLRVSRPTGPDEQFVERMRPVFRGAFEVGLEYTSVQLRNGEEQCGSTMIVHSDLDRQGRPTRSVSRVDNCEGVDPGPHVTRRRWSRGRGFDRMEQVGRGGGSPEVRFEVPSHADRQAEIQCSRRCSCEMEARDPSGRPRILLNSSNPGYRMEYAYTCEGPAWEAMDEAADAL